MRRSRWIDILYLGGAGAVMLTAYSCGESERELLEIPPNVTVFTDEKACTQAGTASYKCGLAFSEAARAHYQGAPRFADRTACEQEFGDCIDIGGPGGTLSYVPPLAGFVLGSALGVAEAVPVYYDRRGNARIAGGNYLLGRRKCEGADPQRQDCSSSGGGGGGAHGGGGGYSKERPSATHTLDTTTTNMRGVTRGGFGLSVHGASG